MKRAQIEREQRELARLRQVVATASHRILQKQSQLAGSRSDTRQRTLANEIRREEERRVRVEKQIAASERRVAALQKEVNEMEGRAARQAAKDADRDKLANRVAVRSLERRVVGLEQVALDRLHQQVSSDPVNREYDCFLSYASEDKELAAALAAELAGRGLSVWWDETELKLGISLQRQLDLGIARSRFRVVLVTPAVLAGRYWTDRELGALLTSRRRVVPVLDNVDFDDLQSWSPMLADTAGLSTKNHGLDDLADRLADAARA